MDREDIIKLAREAHLEALSQGKGMHVWHGDAFISDVQDFCVRFAALVAAAEREACARLCDQMFHDWCNQAFEDEDEACRNKPDAEDCKKAIRARGNT